MSLRRLPQIGQPHRLGQRLADLIEQVHRAGLPLPELLDQRDALLQAARAAPRTARPVESRSGAAASRARRRRSADRGRPTARCSDQNHQPTTSAAATRMRLQATVIFCPIWNFALRLARSRSTVRRLILINGHLPVSPRARSPRRQSARSIRACRRRISWHRASPCETGRTSRPAC